MVRERELEIAREHAVNLYRKKKILQEREEKEKDLLERYQSRKGETL